MIAFDENLAPENYNAIVGSSSHPSNPYKTDVIVRGPCSGGLCVYLLIGTHVDRTYVRTYGRRKQPRPRLKMTVRDRPGDGAGGPTQAAHLPTRSADFPRQFTAGFGVGFVILRFPQ